MLELPEFPTIKDASVGTLKLGNSLDKRLPSMPSGYLNDMSFSNSGQLEAEQLMNEMRIAFGESRAYKKRSEANARAKNRRAQRAAERR